MIRKVITALVVAGVATGVVLLWPKASADDPVTTEALVTTTTGRSADTTTTTAVVHATTAVESHVVTTAEEAEEILRELWYGWFEGIYNQDEERIREVVATNQMLDAGVAAFGADFLTTPSRSDIRLELELLRGDDECLVVWGTLDVSAFRGQGAVTQSLQVLRYVDGGWRFATSWVHREDLWEADCESVLLPLS